MFFVSLLSSLQVSRLSRCVKGLLMPRAASWWQQVGLAANTVAPGGVCCKYCFPAVKWLKVFCYPLPTGSWTSSSAPPSSPSIPSPNLSPSFHLIQMVFIEERSWSTWSRLRTRLLRSAGKSKSYSFPPLPLFTRAAGNGTLAYESLDTHRQQSLSAVIRDTTHWPF